MTRFIPFEQAAAVLVLAAGLSACAQMPVAPIRPGQTGSPASHTDLSDEHPSAAIQERLAIARNDERQKRLQADTDKLLALVTQLKADVDKTDKYTLSLDVVRRSEEIEKLARAIRERAKN